MARAVATLLARSRLLSRHVPPHQNLRLYHNCNRRIFVERASNVGHGESTALALAGGLLAFVAASTSGTKGPAAVAGCDSATPFHSEDEGTGYDEPRRFHNCLAYHRTLLDDYRRKWDYVENPSSRLPTTLWPTDVPLDDDVPGMECDLRYCSRSPNYRNDEAYCDRLKFRVASWLMMQRHDETKQKRGAKYLKDLAEHGYPDGMVGYGIALNEGRILGSEIDPIRAVSWFRLAVEVNSHPQALYELAVALYTGEGVVEDEEMAVRLFRRAATVGHAGAAYMLGDCLLDGVGVERDRAEALEWLVTAGELGHRGARSRVLAVLEWKPGGDYGRFTDGSRQSLVGAVKEVKKAVTRVGIAEEDKKDKEEEQDASGRARTVRGEGTEVNVERRYTIGGGARNPVVLARRRTIVQESREP